MFLQNASPLPTILDKMNGKPRYPPPPLPQIKDGKMALFSPSRGFILVLGGWGFAVPFYFSKIAAIDLAPFRVCGSYIDV